MAKLPDAVALVVCIAVLAYRFDSDSVADAAAAGLVVMATVAVVGRC